MSVSTLAPTRFSSAEYHRMARLGAFKDMRVELRRGMIVRMNAQYAPHAAVKRLLAKAIEQTLDAAALDWIVDQEVSVSVSDDFDPMPDIVVWDCAALPAFPNGPVPGAAVRLVVEIADTSLADDLGEKLEDFARGGLPEYWVADVRGRLILHHAGPGASGYARREPVLFGQKAAWLTQPLEIDTASLA